MQKTKERERDLQLIGEEMIDACGERASYYQYGHPIEQEKWEVAHARYLRLRTEYETLLAKSVRVQGLTEQKLS
jgi:hypothetical protein